MTNREGHRKYSDEWKGLDETNLCAYVGLLILAGMYRSSLWDAESSWAIFRATMPLKLFHTYSRLLHFDNRETRRRRRAMDKLGAVREVWDAWVAQLPSLYNRGPRWPWTSNWLRSEVSFFFRFFLYYVMLLCYVDSGCKSLSSSLLLLFFSPGQCPFRQYMPSKPAKYKIKSCVACDAKSSYAWKMQVYNGKPSGGRPERAGLAGSAWCNGGTARS